MMRKVLFVILISLCAYSVRAQALDPKSSAESYVRGLIAQMTLDEKISQMMNDAAGIPRLGILPYNWWNEGLHGVGRDGRATVFPEPIALGATFDPDLVRKIGDAVATEGRAKYFVAQQNKNYGRYAGLTFWSPNVNIFRDPRWGRGMETYGEDPFLSGTLGTAYVKGMQGDDPFYLKVAACGKHYAVHSGPESTRHQADVHPTRHDLFETYLPQFEMLVRQGHVETIMSAYNRVDGVPCGANKYLLTDILRKKWGFKGHVVSDCWAVNDFYGGHHYVKTAAEASALAVKAGMNLECGQDFKALKDAVAQGLIKESDIDKALFPLMMTRMKLGILKDDPNCPYNHVAEKEICSSEHFALARKAATEAMVLLKNDGVLPIRKNLRSLSVSGPAASDAFYLMGNYFGVSNYYSCYLEGIVGKVSSGTTVNFRPAFAPIETKMGTGNNVWEAAGGDVAIVVMGLNNDMEGEEGESIDNHTGGDRDSLSLPKPQMDFLRQLHKVKKNGIVVVLTGGSPIDVKEISKLADAVIMAWYPGQDGGNALADLLFGDANFSGRLPITFPEDVKKLPPFTDYSMKGRTYKYMTDNIMYPFGYGLSYGQVIYSDVQVGEIKKDKEVQVEATLSNSGKMETTETVQVYLSTPTSGASSPSSSLIAFKKVNVPAGGKTQVHFSIPYQQLGTVMEDGNKKVLKGQYQLYVGGAAPCKRTQELGVSVGSTLFKI